MKGVLTALLILTAVASVCRGSYETLARGIPGSYIRAATAMYSETLLLRADGSYVFTFRFDVGSDQEKGTWGVRDALLVLSPKKRGELIRNWPSQFRILNVDDDLALSVIEAATEAQPEDSPMRLFRPEKRKANQTADPTSPNRGGSP